MTASPQLIQKVCQDLSARGQLVEAGFSAMRSLVIPPSASPAQVGAMRTAFFAGASHVFHSMMAGLDAGSEPTNDDLARMASLQSELQRFETEFAKQLPTRGTA